SQQTVVSWQVKDIGTGSTSAPVWHDRVYLSLDRTPDDTDVFLGDAANPPYLAVNHSYTNSLTVTPPRGVAANYSFVVRAAVFNQVNELGAEGANVGPGGRRAST